MRYHFRKPELTPTIAMFVTVALMSSLGIWQLHRLEWKNALQASIESAQSQAPRPLLSYPEEELPQAEWHNVTATGTLINDKELIALPRYLNGQLGYAVLTPMAVGTPHARRAGPVYVLINRGWVPREKKDPATRAAGNPAGPVTITGAIRVPQAKKYFTPENDPAKNAWFWYDIPAMKQATGLPLLPVMIDATDVKMSDGTTVKDGPTPFPLEITLRNDHLGYAITWFLIGLSAIGVYVAYYTEKK